MLGVSIVAAAQSSQSQGTAPAPAFGQQNVPILDPENPPLSGLDEPSLELRTSSRSFISPALQIGESGDSNADNNLNTGRAAAITHLLGALDLQKFWPRSDAFLEYVGGAAFGDSPYFARQIQALGVEGVTRWRTGQLTVRDAFDYLPDGTFYASGGIPGFGIATGAPGLGLPGIYRLGYGTGGTIGTIPRLANTGVLDVVQSITPRSAFTVIGSFSNAHYYHNVNGFLNGDETTIESGYSHMVSRHDQVAAVYAYQLFRFPDNQGGEVYNHVFNVRWSHTISGRLSFVGGIGPQYTDLLFGSPLQHWSIAGRATLRYRFAHASLMLNYDKFTSQGSGFFAGADTQRAHVNLRRPLGRSYDFLLDAGYSNNKRLQAAGGVSANSYNETAAGVVVRRHLGRTFDAIVAYHFAEVWFNVPTKVGTFTGTSNQRSIGTIALEWHPRPIRIE